MPTYKNKDHLKELCEKGLSQREIAERFSISQTTVRYWLKKNGLSTHGNRSREHTGVREKHKDGLCKIHGKTSFVLYNSRNTYRCRKCDSERVHRHRTNMIARLKLEAGGKCTICGYNTYFGALEFHHLDAQKKLFNVNTGSPSYSYKRYKAEAEKCVLLCSNCHKEVEAGITGL